MRKPDQMWFSPVFAMAQDRKRAVVKSSAHTKPITTRVKPHERQQNKIKLLCAHKIAPAGRRLEYTEVVGY